MFWELFFAVSAPVYSIRGSFWTKSHVQNDSYFIKIHHLLSFALLDQFDRQISWPFFVSPLISPITVATVENPLCLHLAVAGPAIDKTIRALASRPTIHGYHPYHRPYRNDSDDMFKERKKSRWGWFMVESKQLFSGEKMHIFRPSCISGRKGNQRGRRSTFSFSLTWLFEEQVGRDSCHPRPSLLGSCGIPTKGKKEFFHRNEGFF